MFNEGKGVLMGRWRRRHVRADPVQVGGMVAVGQRGAAAAPAVVVIEGSWKRDGKGRRWGRVVARILIIQGGVGVGVVRRVRSRSGEDITVA